jgi:hypothetical protein
MGAYFVFATLVQINDPDAPVWELMYAAAAAVSFFAAWRAPPVWAPAALAVVAGIWALALLPSAITSSFHELFATWRMMSAEMEIGRETLGLAIVVVWMTVLARKARRAAAYEASARARASSGTH